MPSTRIAGKLGANLRPKPVELHWLEHALASPLGSAPASVDHTGGRQDWQMLGNDTHGDCAVAGAVHLRMVDAIIAKETEKWPSAGKVVSSYLQYTRGQDVGCVLADLLRYWHAHGLLGDQIEAFAPLRITSLTEVKAATALFGAVYLGVKIPRVAMTQFNAGQPWDLTGTRADDDYAGGHCVISPKYDRTGGEVVTWGKLQPFTWSWFEHNTDEGWVVITSEFVKAHPGVINMPLLRADIAKLAA